MEGLARRAIPLAIQGPLLVFGLGSTFYSCQRMDLPYLFLMAAASWWEIERNRTVAVNTGENVNAGLEEGEVLVNADERT